MVHRAGKHRRRRVGGVSVVFAVTAARIDADDPLSGLELGERPEPVPPGGWVTVQGDVAPRGNRGAGLLRFLARNCP
jgi:hypothetical protein